MSEQNNIDLAKALSDLRAQGRVNLDDGAVLVQLPQVSMDLIEPEVVRNRGYFAYPPLGLLYLSAVLRQKGVDTTVLDLNYLLLTLFSYGARAVCGLLII